MSADQTKKSGSLLRRAPWEMAMTVMIGVGILMLVQPFALSLYTYSFITILIGTLGFVVVSHFPE
jgi:amino acid transporter